jgi:5'-nucleotidase
MREDKALDIGAGYPLIKALLNLNGYREEDCRDIEKVLQTPLVEVAIVSKKAVLIRGFRY